MGTRDIEIEHLRSELGPEVDEALNSLDYRSLRRELGKIGAGYHNIRHLSNDPAPATLSMGIAGFVALQRLLVIVKESGLLDEIRGKTGRVVRPYAKEVLPSLDAQLVDDDELLEAILRSTVGEDDKQEISEEDLKKLAEINADHLAEVLVVDVHSPVKWQERPRVNAQRQARRLRVAGIVAKMLAGGLMLGANAAVGVLSPFVFSLPTDAGSAPLLVALVGSARAGLRAIGEGGMALAEEMG